jgi:hypothetical protein
MEEFILLAKEDLDISSLLLKEKKYTNAFYHYHQSVEKTTKYVGLSIGGITEEQLFEIKHDPLKVFTKLLHYWHLGSKGYLPNYDPHIITNLKQLIDKSSDEEFILGIRNNLKSIREQKLAINEKNFASPFEALCDYSKQTRPDFDFHLDNELFRQYAITRLGVKSKNLINAINYGTKILLLLLMNSTVCCRYSPDQLRYPSKKIKNPLEYFSESHLLIKELPLLLISMRTSIEMASQIKWNFDSDWKK